MAIGASLNVFNTLSCTNHKGRKSLRPAWRPYFGQLNLLCRYLPSSLLHDLTFCAVCANSISFFGIKLFFFQNVSSTYLFRRGTYFSMNVPIPLYSLFLQIYIIFFLIEYLFEWMALQASTQMAIISRLNLFTT